MPFFFFTEYEKLIAQSQMAFGSIDTNQYRLGNLSDAITSPKAFSICDGNIMLQDVASAPTKVNLVLKPTEQPDLGLPKIAYIIYKSILKESLIEADGTIANTSKNDLTRKIWASHELQKNAFNESPDQTPPNKAKADDVLGYAYRSNGQGENMALDNDNLDKAFFGGKPLFPVKGGDYIGDFSLNGIGIIVIFEKIGFNATFKLARETDSIFNLITSSAPTTEAEEFARRHEREAVIPFLDSATFFSLFSLIGLEAFSGTEMINLKGAELYNNITSKFFNKRKVYFDIRNEFDDSLNYYGNFGDSLGIAFDGSMNYTTINYYRNHWPVLVLDDSEIPSSNLAKEIKFNMPVRGSRIPTLYLKRAFRADIGNDKLPSGEKKFPQLLAEDIVDSKIALSKGLVIPALNNQIYANYFQIKYFTNIPDKTENVDFDSLLYRKCYPDNLFPIFDMHISFKEGLGKSSFKLFYDVGYTDKKLIRGADFTHVAGIAKDDNFYTFISFPYQYNINPRAIGDDKIPLGSLEGAASKPFLSQISGLMKNVKLVEGKFVLPGGLEKKYLKFVVDAANITKGGIGSNYTFEDFTALLLTHAQFDILKTLKEQHFNNVYKVYLGITNVLTGTDTQGKSYQSFKYQLNGLKEENGKMVNLSIETGIEIYTDQMLIGKPYVRNYEEMLGIDNIKAKFETYFIGLSTPIKAVVDGFEKQMNTVDIGLPSSASKIESLITKYGKDLWNNAKNWVQANPNNADDRPLYWARIRMSVIIKSHIFFAGDLDASSQVLPQSLLENVVRIFEESSRNYKSINFANAGNRKKILVTGFDPFVLNPKIERSNPSGCVALTVEDTTTMNNVAAIQTMIFPVRYTDFDGSKDPEIGTGIGIIEKYIAPWINQVDMIITVSQSAPFQYNIDKFGTLYRGGATDNLMFSRVKYSEALPTTDADLNWLETTLPSTFIAEPVKYSWEFTDVNNVIHNTVDQKPANGAILHAGSGGDYLSNEIFYRVARLRQASNPALATGHFHIAQIQGDSEDFSGLETAELLSIVKTAINRGVTGI